MLARRFPALSNGLRALSSFHSTTGTSQTENLHRAGSGSVREAGRDTLSRRLISLIYPKLSAVVVLNKWTKREGKHVQKYQLNRVIRELRKYKRYKHTLEICEWMKSEPSMKLLPGDYAVHLDLVAKIRGLTSAEKFFEDMPEKMKGPSTCSSLLHTYVQFNYQEKAESLMKEMLKNGFITCPLPFNHMLTLYLSNGELEKIPTLIKEMRKYVIPDVVTYNLYLTSCARENNLKEAEKAYEQMNNDKITPDWYTYSLIANICIKSGYKDIARERLTQMEKMASKKERAAYSSLISLYTSLLDRENVDRVWNHMISMFRKLSDVEYKCMISSLTKFGDINTAEDLYKEWDSVSGTRDSRVANIILSFYINNGMIIKAEKFKDEIIQKGIRPCYSTWELLARGYLKKKSLYKVIEYFKTGLSCLQKWEPNLEFVRDVFSLIEEERNVEKAEEFVGILREKGCGGIEIYNLLLRVYEKAEKLALSVEKRMGKDGVCLDDETRRLIRVTSKFSV